MRRNSVIPTGWLVLGLTLAAAVTTAHAAEPPFVGVVTGDNVYVRSGPARSYYFLTKLNTGDLVKVTGAVPGWYSIAPVKGVDHLVSKKYVRLAEDGKTGAVTGDRVNVRALNPGVRPEDSTFTEHHYRYSKTKLDSGDTVVVTGALEDFYRIVPPKGVNHFVSTQFVTKATDEQIAEARKKEAAEQQDAVEAVADATVEVVEGTADVTVDAAEVVVDTTVTVAEGAADVTVDAAEVVADTTVTVVEGAADVTVAAAEAVVGDDAKEPVGADHTETVVETPAKTGAAPLTITITEGDVPIETPAETTTVVPDTTVATTQTETVEPVGVATEIDTTQPAEVVEEVEPIKIDTTAPADQQLAELETIFSDESAKPLADQNVAGLLAAYEALGKHEGLADDQKQVVATRVDLLSARAELKQTIAKLTETKTQFEQQQQERGTPAKEYAAVGKLLTSTVYTGGRMPLLYRLADPLSGLTIGYVDPGADRGLARYLGKVVGIVGDSQYDQGLRLKIITVEEIDALTAGR